MENDTVVLDVIFQNYFQESLLEDVTCENCSLGSSESIKSTFTVLRYLKETPSVLKIIFQTGTYDTTTSEAIKNKLKVAIPSEYLCKTTSGNDNISYTLVSLINHDGESLNCGYYVSDVFDDSTGIWWHCDDDNTTQISDFTKRGLLYRESQKYKKSDVRINRCIICCLYQNKLSEKYSFNYFPRFHQHVQNNSYEESN